MSLHTVTHRNGLAIIEGAIPVNEMVAIIQQSPEGSVMDAQLARGLNANIVIGLHEDCEAEKARLGLSRTPPAEISDLPMQAQIRAWLNLGDVGASSEAMALHFLEGSSKTGLPPFPRDLDDFERCRLLLEWVPGLRARLTCLRDLSPSWGHLSEAWCSIERLLDEGSTKEAYRRLKLSCQPPSPGSVDDYL